MKIGIELIAEERQRQIEVEGFKPEDDLQHEEGDLAHAASCYAAADLYRPINELLARTNTVNLINKKLKLWKCQCLATNAMSGLN